MKKILTVVSIFHFCIAYSQVYVELGPVQNNRDAFSSVVVYGSDGLAQKVSYSSIRGSAFWNENWMDAMLYNQQDTFLGVYKARFNYVTNEVHYIGPNNEEQAVIPGTLNTVVFLDSLDKNRIVAVFRANIADIRKKTSCKNCFALELNDGEAKLMRITKRQVKTGDSLFYTAKKYYFSDENEYFLKFHDRYERIRRLNKESILSQLPNTSIYAEWIKQKGLQFTNEEDVLIFLNYYNSNRKNG